jgi:hypothetical protein
MNTKFFKDIPIAHRFVFGEMEYVKLSNSEAANEFGAIKTFNKLEIVDAKN